MPETSRPPLPDGDRQRPPPPENSLDGAVRSLLAPIWDKLAKIETRLDAAAPPPPPITADFPSFPDLPTGSGSWENIVLGDELAQDFSWDTVRREFLDAVAGGDRAARFLAGQLMLVQNAPADKMSELLKNVGEAYYRWRPRRGEGEDPMEQALVSWLNRLVEQARLPNSIQPVRPGDRFDNSRHIANGRGVEVVEVQGWVVLRDGNRVYTKANVTVK